MSFPNRVRIVCTCLFVALSVCCVDPEPTKTMNTTPYGEETDQHELAEFFAYHNDQGMMHDMSIADIHFVPHMAHLSGTGEARLERYAELLATTGGALRYDTRVRDKRLVEARLAVARDFLAQSIPSNNTISVVLGQPGGRGILASEAIAGQGVARQPEPRETAYRLNAAGGGASGG